MKRGGQKFLVSTTMLAVAACGGEQGKLEIRSIPTALARARSRSRIGSPKRAGNLRSAMLHSRSKHFAWPLGTIRTAPMP